METMIHMGLHAILDVVEKVVASVTTSGTCSCIYEDVKTYHPFCQSDYINSGVSPLAIRQSLRLWMDNAV
eukprot:6194367-Pleurochrysis_carterae.AAC.2